MLYVDLITLVIREVQMSQPQNEYQSVYLQYIRIEFLYYQLG